MRTDQEVVPEQRDQFAGVVGSNETAEDLIGRADKAMYQAKKAGKNRAVAAD